MAAVHVVFVCTGNICRSPVAESVFRARLAEAGLGHLGALVEPRGPRGLHRLGLLGALVELVVGVVVVATGVLEQAEVLTDPAHRAAHATPLTSFGDSL